MKDQDLYRIYRIKPPVFDPASDTFTDCQHEDVDHLFFGRDIAEPEGRESGEKRIEREHEARMICAGCPFLVECGLHALEHEDYGVWGGMSEQDRRAFGGRGIAVPGPSNPRAAIKRMRAAGIPSARITKLIARWREEKAA